MTTLEDLPEDRPQPEVAEFYTRPVVDQEATLKEGRTIHKEAVYLRISFPGDKTLEVDRPLREEDKKRFPRHWLAFQASKPQDAATGTLLSSWGHLSPAQVEDYRFLRITTVEQLASVPDAHIHKLGLGAVGHRQAAQDFLEAAKSRAPLLRLQRELEEERAQRQALSEQMNQLFAMQKAQAADEGVDVSEVEEVHLPSAPAVAARKRGRPAKAKVAP